jgi:hypothetical protein
MLDYTGRAVEELRAAVATWPEAYADYEVVGGNELEPEQVPKSGRAPKIIKVVRQHPIRRRRAPLADYGFVLTIYHPDPRHVSLVASLVSDAFHDRGPRVVTASGRRIGAYISADTGGAGGALEPDTKWPYERVAISIIAPTVALT